MERPSKIKKILIPLLIVVLAGGSIASYWYVTKPKSKKGISIVSEATKSETEKKDVETAKSFENNNSKQAGQEQSTAQAGTANVSISSAGVSGQSLYVNGLVSGTTSGTCKLILSNGATKIEKSAGVGLQISYYICQGFSVPLGDIVPKGEWSALIELSSPNGNTRSEVKKVTVQ